MSKMKDQRWSELPRQAKLARLAWPSLMEPEYRDDVTAVFRNQGKQAPPMPSKPVPTAVTSIDGKPVPTFGVGVRRR
jgi:hypothetical protein